MLFNSPGFLVFFVVVSTLYFWLPLRARWLLLLGASCYFYMAFIPIYILILGFTIAVDYFAGLLIERAEGRRRRWFLVMSLVANIGVLSVFKYYNFLNANLARLFALVHAHDPIPALTIILPIGLSFHTFQAMSYTIEVYRRRQPAERSFLLYALYVMFYPQLVAGPIERPQNLLPQFRDSHRFDYQRVTEGLKRMAFGFFRKVVVADRLSPIVDAVYHHPHRHSGANLAVATVLFAFQIYADFSGYSEIAIGAAQVLGVRLMTNFRQPYLAQSIADFRQRWHISLSTWFRDYLYIPLGGNRVSRPRWYVNLLLTFLISGLWHGANWTYVVWGGLNGVYLIGGLLTADVQARVWPRLGALAPTLRRLLTFGLITVSWVFFRARTVDDGLFVLARIVRDGRSLLHPGLLLDPARGLGVPAVELALAAGATVVLIGLDLINEGSDLAVSVARRPPWQRWALYYGLGLATIFLGRFGGQQFIYFQF